VAPAIGQTAGCDDSRPVPTLKSATPEPTKTRRDRLFLRSRFPRARARSRRTRRRVARHRGDGGRLVIGTSSGRANPIRCSTPPDHDPNIAQTQTPPGQARPNCSAPARAQRRDRGQRRQCQGSRTYRTIRREALADDHPQRVKRRIETTTAGARPARSQAQRPAPGIHSQRIAPRWSKAQHPASISTREKPRRCAGQSPITSRRVQTAACPDAAAPPLGTECEAGA